MPYYYPMLHLMACLSMICGFQSN